MGRRFRTVLSLGAGAALMAGIAVGRTGAQPPPNAPVPIPAATPWVQAPPAAPEPSKPTVSLGATPTLTPGNPMPPPKPVARPKFSGVPLPGGSVRPGAPGQADAVEDARLKPERERKEGFAADREQTPDEQKTYEQNLQLWNRMTPDERRAMRQVVGGHMQVEIEEAYQRSKLNLNEDQREMFDLRYRQERRRVERDVQEVARRERERRLPAIDEKLRKEFGQASAVNTVKSAASPAATVVPEPKPVAPETKPMATPTPAGTATPVPVKG